SCLSLKFRSLTYLHSFPTRRSSDLHEDGWVWNSGFQASARIDRGAHVWYAFMRIPFASVDMRPAAVGNALRINCFLSEGARPDQDRKSTRLNSSHGSISYAVFCLKK